MGEDTLQDSVIELINAINSYDSISAVGLKDTMFPDDLILAIHNHIGNVNQFIGSASEAFNGAEQSVAYKSAQTELDALSSNLFSASQTGLIGEPIFRNLDNKIRNLISRISDVSDPGYF